MQAWLEELAAIDDAVLRSATARTRTMPDDAPEQVHGALVAALYSNFPRAQRLADVGKSVAEVRSDAISQAFARKCQAHVAYVRGDHESAIAGYEEALGLFDRSGEDLEAARTQSSGLQTLILLGRYDQARAWAARAEKVFLRHGDVLRLARLDSNVGNIFFRQDQPREAIVHYQRALAAFQTAGDAKDTAAVLSNLAVCHTNLAQFSQAFASYGEARDLCARNGLQPLAAQADYNIAYLYYLRGDYRKARELYAASRERADAYHAALCDLDEAELVLELNLTQEGEELAGRAQSGFARLGMRYEQAKALVNLAVAASQRRDLRSADAKLRRARALFEEEGNRTWSAMTDLLRAVLAFHEGRLRTARVLGSAAWKVLATTTLPGRAAYCQILLAQLWLRSGHPDRARAIGRAAIQRLGDDLSPSIRFHANLLEGEVHEMQGRRAKAMESYEAARAEIEDLRGRLDTEDLRISILKDKVALYESLIALCLDSPGAPAAIERAMLLVQQAKSRTLTDRLHGAYRVNGAERSSTREVSEAFENLRQELNSCYRQMHRGESTAEAVRERAREIECELLRMRPSVSARIGPSLKPGMDAEVSIAEIQNALDHETLLIEFFEARGVLHAFLMDRGKLDAVGLGSAAPVRQHLKLLQFQLGKSRGTDPRRGLDATLHHCRELYRLLLAPIEARLSAYERLVIAPYRHLHSLPFAALFDGSRHLVDRFTITTIPSAAVFVASRARGEDSGAGSVVMAVGHEGAPRIEEEGAMIAQILPEAKLFSGAAATIGALRANCSGLRVLHLATHGVFRKDNPLFSSIQLADGRLNLIDLNLIDRDHPVLDADLVTLSACSTGSAVSIGGDELLGMIRGFLAAGARSLVASLWEIDDHVTKEFMKSFYTNLLDGAEAAKALRGAMIEVRGKYAHPYYWSPFIFVGGEYKKTTE